MICTSLQGLYSFRKYMTLCNSRFPRRVGDTLASSYAPTLQRNWKGTNTTRTKPGYGNCHTMQMVPLLPYTRHCGFAACENWHSNNNVDQDWRNQNREICNIYACPNGGHAKQCYTPKSTRFRDVHKPIPRADSIPFAPS